MSYKIFCYYKDDQVVWFRFFGYGISISRMKVTYTERQCNKYFNLPFGWKLKFLSKPKVW